MQSQHEIIWTIPNENSFCCGIVWEDSDLNMLRKLHKKYCCLTIAWIVSLLYMINVNHRGHCIYQEVIENLNKGDLPKSDYACKNEPVPASKGNSTRSSTRNQTTQAPTTAPNSIRSRRTANWAKSRASDDGYSRWHELLPKHKFASLT